MTRESHARRGTFAAVVRPMLGVLLAGCLVSTLGGCASENEAAPGGTSAAPQTPAEVMIEAGVDHIDKFLGHEQTVALRNILGGKEEQVLVLIMTGEAMDNFEHGRMEIGGTGGFAIGTYGMGASGAGGIKGGLELILVSTNEGAFLGSGLATTKPKLATDLNAQVYGPNADTDAILAGTGGRYAPANRVRQRLGRMVVEAWDIPPGQPVASSPSAYFNPADLASH